MTNDIIVHWLNEHAEWFMLLIGFTCTLKCDKKAIIVYNMFAIVLHFLQGGCLKELPSVLPLLYKNNPEDQEHGSYSTSVSVVAFIIHLHSFPIMTLAMNVV